MEKIMKYIDAHRAEAVAFLQKMISLESTFVDQGVYGNEGNAQVWLEKQVREWNFETSLFEPEWAVALFISTTPKILLTRQSPSSMESDFLK